MPRENLYSQHGLGSQPGKYAGCLNRISIRDVG